MLTAFDSIGSEVPRWFDSFKVYCIQVQLEHAYCIFTKACYGVVRELGNMRSLRHATVFIAAAHAHCLN